MKKALLLAIAGLLSAVAPALAYPPAPANVNFSSERGVPFRLALDGRPLTRGAARQVHVDQLVPGVHWADFTLPGPYGGAVRFRSRVWLEPGLETSFVLIARPGYPLALRQVDAVALCRPYGCRSYGNRRYNGGGNYYNSPAPYDQGGPDYGSPANGNALPNGYDNGSDYDEGDDDGSGYYPGSAVSSYRTLPPQEVNSLVQAVRRQRFEANKLSTAKEALGAGAIQTEDLKRLLLALEFEASRVELAKFAYPHVTDPQNFNRVYQAFNYEASKQEVQQAVSAAPQR
ncbi:DUF4476 domain-containing protein [Hymenobacter terrenus]|uniref:DUF4476 domain-containing protein n=1 Tax=Hymenobacter terrenus TaxID=1629124 RepID=UPI0006199506|nr:DUF4476 domain-containing protein [Hymenobacter terrenus]